MTWYYYSGMTVVPVPVKPGVSVSVRRGEVIDIEIDSPELEALKNAKVMKRTGRPKYAREIKQASEIKISDVVKPSSFADTVVEIGFSDKNSPYIPGENKVFPRLINKKADENKENIEMDGDVGSDEKYTNEDEKEIAQDGTMLEDGNKKVRKKRRIRLEENEKW